MTECGKDTEKFTEFLALRQQTIDSIPAAVDITALKSILAAFYKEARTRFGWDIGLDELARQENAPSLKTTNYQAGCMVPTGMFDFVLAKVTEEDVKAAITSGLLFKEVIGRAPLSRSPLAFARAGADPVAPLADPAPTTTGWRRLTESEWALMGMPNAKMRPTGCGELFTRDMIDGPKDSVGMDIRFATGWIVSETCRASRQEMLNQRDKCLAKITEWRSAVDVIDADKSRSEADKIKAKRDAYDLMMVGCTQDPAYLEDQKRMCDTYEDNGIRLAECDCSHVTQVPSLEDQASKLCRQSSPELSLDEGYEMTEDDCKELEDGRGLPVNYTSLKNSRLSNIIARYMTRVTATEGRGNFLTCNYMGCSKDMSRYIHMDVLQAQRQAFTCKVPMCQIKIQQRWSPDAKMNIIGNRITLNCSKIDGTSCSGHGALQPDGSCVCEGGYSGRQCNSRGDGGGASGGDPTPVPLPTPAPAPAPTPAAAGFSSFLESNWWWMALALVALVALVFTATRVTKSEELRAKADTLKLEIEMQKLNQSTTNLPDASRT
jgi:hypothetical protein